MRRSPTPTVPVTSRTTAPRRRGGRSESGDTLVEVLLALVVLGMASVALLIAFGTSISASAEHRNIAEYNTILATASQEAIAAIDAQASLFVDACTTPISAYPDQSGFPLPQPYTGQFNVTYVAATTANQSAGILPVQWWNGSSYSAAPVADYATGAFPTPPCEDNQPQLITIGFTVGGTQYTNSFVAEYPVTQKNSFSGDATSRQLVFTNATTVGGGSGGTAVSYAGIPLNVQPVIDVNDVNGVPVTTDLSPVTMVLTDMNGSVGTLSGCQGNEVLGVVTFTGCSVSAGGTYELTATINGTLNSVTSSAFTVNSSTYTLQFTSGGQPAGGVSGSAFTTSPQVGVYVTSSLSTTPMLNTGWGGTVTFTFSGGVLTNCTSSAPYTSTATTVTLNVQNGLATLPSGCDFEGGYFFNPNSSPQITATQYTITATANPNVSTNAAVPALSSAFSVTSFGPAAKLAFSTEPTGAESGTGTTGGTATGTFAGAPAVEVEDAFGNQVTSATQATFPVTLTMSKGSTSETLNCNTPNVANGIYTFSGCAGNAYNTGLTLKATSTGTVSPITTLTPATSTAFNITGVTTQILFNPAIVPPATTPSGQPVAEDSGSNFAVQPTLLYEDAANNVVTAETAPVTLTTSGGVLSSCTNLVPVLGYVNVANCTFAGVVGTNYTMTATATVAPTGTISVVSTPFSPAGPGVASQLIFQSSPVAAASTYQFAIQPVLIVEDSQGNVATTTSVTVSLTTSGGTLANCANLTSAAGLINVANCTFAGVVGTQYTMTASSVSPILSSSASSSFSPTGPGPVTQIILSGCPSAITTTKTCVETATLEDSYANVETGDNSSAVTFAQVSGSGTVTGLGTHTDAAGIANDTLTAANPGSVTIDAAADSLTSSTFTTTVNALPAVTTTSLAAATDTQTGYAQTLTSSGGTSPQTWSISAGTLPSGLSLNAATGVISGTVGSTATTQTFTVKITDADNFSATQSLTLTVNAVPNITTTTAATATDTQTSYSQPVAITGGTAPFAWSISSGSLPTGLSINPSTGTISGSVGASATTQTFTVLVTDAYGVSDTQSLTINVNAAPNITTTSLPAATKTGAYSQTLTETGGTAPLSNWSVSQGSLPTGLTLNGTTGVISGTVSSSASTQTFTVSITDANGVNDTQSLTITVNAAPTISTTSLATATDTETGYSQTLATTGGTTPFTWSLSAGSLPSGLTLDPALGIISGTVGSSATTQTFTVQLTDANNVTTTKSLTITVNAVPNITTTTAATATDTQTGYSQTLAETGGTTPLTWSVVSGTLPSGLSISSTTGTISGTVGASAATQTFTVQVADANGVTDTQVLTITVNAAPVVTTASLPGGTKTGTYSQTLTETGGTAPSTWSISTGILPTGLTLNGTTGVISGTVNTAAVSETFTVKITDANNVSATKSLTITVNAAPSVTTASLATATDTQTTYSQTLAATGGTTPYAWTVTTGSLPSGLVLNASTGVINGTVGASATTQTFTVTVTDADGVTATKSLTITVNAAPSVTTTSLATATNTETGYSQTLAATGGTAPLGTWSVSSGVLPTGLTLNATSGVISGTVGAGAVTETFTVKISDANSVAATKSLTITVNAAPVVTTASLPGATLNGTYSQTLAASGGTTPKTWAVTTGSLPAGLNLVSSTGVISGTVGASATTQTFTVTVTDANAVTAIKSLTITINAAPSVTTTTLATATDNQTTYSQTLVGSGGTTPYAWTVTTGALPSGLVLGSATGIINGTVGASATTQTFTVTLTDADGVTATKSLTITVNAAPVVTTSSLAAATQNETGYSQTLTESGGTAPITWSISTGSLPTGLTLTASTGAISGTVGASATSQTFTVKATDANSVAATQSLTITVAVAPSVSTTTLATATQNQTTYSQTLTSTGGTAPITWSISSGSLPTGLVLNASTGVINGTVGASATTQTFTVKATDANSISGTKSLTITVNVAPTVTTTTLPAATQTGAYSQTLAHSGGTTPFGSWSLSTGSLPTGLTLTAATGVISGTVGASATTQTFTVSITDANGVTATQSITLTVNTPPTVTTTTLASATDTQTGYAQTLAATNGTTPYSTWSVSTGSLPTGLTLNALSGVISGTVGASATTQTFTVKVLDANSVAGTQSLTITVAAAPVVTTTSPLATATDTQTTYSQTLAASGGTTPLTWAVTTGSLPTGLTLTSSTGVISGTLGASAATATFTVTVTDNHAVTATKSLTITVNAAPAVTTASLPSGVHGTAYTTSTLAASGGTAPLTWTLSSGSLPLGLSLSTAGVISGTLNASATTQTFTVKVTDSNGVAATKSFTITVT